MATKQIVLRNGVTLLGPLGAGTGDPMLTRDNITKQVGEVPSVDTSSYLPVILPNGRIFVGNSLNIATPVQMSGMVTLANTGVATITANSISNVHLSASAGISYSKLNLNNSITNSDIHTSAAIARTKLANGNINRVLINNGSGIFSEADAILGDRLLISNVNGIPIHSPITATEAGYLAGVSSPIQAQINNRLLFSSSITPVEGDLVYYTSGAWNKLARGSTGQVLTSTSTSIQWGSGVSNGIPAGGTTGQYLNKVDNTDYNVQWSTLNLSKITDVTATASNVNILTGTTVTSTQLNYLTGVTSNIQTQINNKLDNSLSYNSLFIGNVANLPIALPPGTEGEVLTISSGAPVWSPLPVPGNVSGIAPSTDNAIVRWNGTSADSIQNSAVIISDTNNITGIVSLSFASGIITTTPANDDALTQVLVRDSGTGEIKYRTVGSIGGGTITGGGTAGQVTYWSGATAITSEAAFTYDATNNILKADRFNSVLSADPSGGVTNGDLYYNSTALDYRSRINGQWCNITRPEIVVESTTARTLTEADRNKVIFCTNSSTVTITGANLSTGFLVTIVKAGTGDVTFAPDTGLTLEATDPTVQTQYGAATFVKRSSTVWAGFGALGAGGGGGSSSLTSTYVGYGGVSNTLTGESAFTYNATDNVMNIDRIHYTPLASAPSGSVSNGDLYYNSTDLDFIGRVNTQWTNITRPGQSLIDTTDSPYTILESERNFVTYVDTSAGDVTITLTTKSQHWMQTFINTGTNDLILSPGAGITLNAADTVVSTQYGAVTVVYQGTNTFYAFGALGAGAGSGTVTSVDVSGGTTGLTTSGGPITGSGTITFAGTLIAANGGTGQSSYTVGDILYASGATTLSKLAGIATGNALISGGIATAPSWGKIGLSTHISGTLPIGNGGTGLTSIGVADQLLRVNSGGTALEYFTPVFITTTTGGVITSSKTIDISGFDLVFTGTSGGATHQVSIDNTGGVGLYSSGAVNEINIYTDNGLGAVSQIDVSSTRILLESTLVELSGSSVTPTTNASVTSRQYVLGAKTYTGKQTFLSSTTAAASINVPSGSTPTTGITDGDIWQNSNHLYARLNGVTYQIDQQPGTVGDGDKGDITVSSGASVWTIDNDVVTFAKMQNITTSRLLGRTTASSGDIEELTVSNGLTLTSGALKWGGALTANTTISGTFNTTFDQTLTIGVRSGSTPLGTFSVGNLNEASALYSVALGENNLASATTSLSTGLNTTASGTSSFSGGAGTTSFRIVSSGTASFNFSTNDASQTSGHGALATGSVILGGLNNNIESGNTRAVVIGGNAIKLTSTTYIDTVAVPSFAIFTTPSTGTGDDVLTWDATTKKIRKVTAASLGGGGGITAIGTIDTQTKSANGAVISGSSLYMQTADATSPGLVSIGPQTLAGVKTFSSAPIFSTMTSGSILFAGTSGTLTQDNANLFWDDTNNTLGIGTATPDSSHNLHIDKSQNAATQAMVSNANTGTAATAGYRVSLTTNAASNYATFSILGTNYTTSGLLTANTAVLESNASAPLLISNLASNDIIFATTSGRTERMRISSAGNVTIAGLTAGRAMFTGTSGLLTTDSTYTFDSTSKTVTINNSVNTSLNGFSVINTNTGVSAVATYRLFNNSGSAATDGARIAFHGSNMTNYGNALSIQNLENGPVVLWANNTEWARLTATGYFGVGLAVGTNATAKVHARAANNDKAFLADDDAGNRILELGETSNARYIKLDLGSDATGDLHYRDSSGNLVRLGIGTPGQVLTVSSGLPAWASGGSGITNSAANTEIAKSDGTNLISGKVFIPSNGNLKLGDTGLTGSRTISVESSSTNADLIFTKQGEDSVYDFTLAPSTTFRLDSSVTGNVIFTNVSGSYFFIEDSIRAGSNMIQVGDLTQSTYYTEILTVSNVSTVRPADGHSGSNNGKDIQLLGGTAYAISGNGNGGSILLQSGAKNGTGVDGNVNLDPRAGVITLTNGSTTPSGGIANKIQIYSKDVSSSAELFVMDEGGFETQLS